MNADVTQGWLSYCANPTKPKWVLPYGAVDAHCHVFGPADQFPYAEERKYTPVDASKEQLFALRDFLGFTRNVIVQASCHGTDNSALVDALLASHGLARGVATIKSDITDEQLQLLHNAGVRGVRFNFVKRLVDFTPKEELENIASRISRLGWHVVVYFEAADLPELWHFFTSLPTIVVIDHMGRLDVSQDINGPEFARLIKLMQENKNIWCKVSCPERLTLKGPYAINGQQNSYTDVVPFAKYLVENFSDRVLFGTDWPHPNLKSHMPDDGLLVDYIQQIAVSSVLQQKLLVDNPMRLYWPTDWSRT